MSRPCTSKSTELYTQSRALGQQLLIWMQRGGSGLPKGSQGPSGSSNANLAEHNRVATLPVLRDVAAVRDNVHADNGFQVKVNAHGFTPEEPVVQVDGQRLMVTGRRQTEGYSPDGGSYRVAHKMHRQVLLPRNLGPAAMTCSLTPSGQLCVRCQGRALPSSEAPAVQPSRLRSHASKEDFNLA